MEFEPERLRRRRRFPDFFFDKSWIGRIDEKRHGLRRREQFVEHFQFFATSPAFNWVTPVTLPPGRLRLAKEAESDGIAAHFEDYWNCLGCCLRRERGWGGGCGNHSELTMNKIVHHHRSWSL